MGDRGVCTSTLEWTAEGVARVLSSERSEAMKNKPIYIYSAPVSERKVTSIVSKIKETEFKETDLSIDAITKEAFKALEKGDKSTNMNFYAPFCYEEGYGGDSRYQAWNEKLGLRGITDGEL